MLIAFAAWSAAADTDYFQVRGGIPNGQHYFKANVVGNQHLFFIGDSVLAGTGLKDAELRYSAQMVKGFKKDFPQAEMHETRHSQPGGSWLGLYRSAAYNSRHGVTDVAFLSTFGQACACGADQNRHCASICRAAVPATPITIVFGNRRIDRFVRLRNHGPWLFRTA